MNVAIELPENIADLLQQRWGDLLQHTLETLAYDIGAERLGAIKRVW